MKDLSGLMKQAKEMQEKMNQAQAEIAEMEVEGASGAGLVKVTLTGKGEMRRLAIDPSLINPEEVEVLEDLILAAFNDAKRKADAAVQEKMAAVAGPLAGMMPDGLKPF